jgi:hypothetical protein
MKNTGLIILIAAALFACNNSKKDKSSAENTQPPSTNTTNTTTSTPATNSPDRGAKITIDGKEIDLSGSLLVKNDERKLQPGAGYICMLTATGGPDNESLTLNFLLALKPGIYPVTGMSVQRGPNGNGELYGGIMGGEVKLTSYKVNITECKDLGSNNLGGHKWSITGYFDELVIPAMGAMLMDKTKNHPKEIKIEKGSFSNLTFDDNWTEMMKKAGEMMKK